MNKKDKKNILEFKRKESPLSGDYTYEADEIEASISQIFDLPEDFIVTGDNLDKTLTLMGFYRMMGLDEEAVLNATFMFLDVFGDLLGLVPERNFDENK